MNAVNINSASLLTQFHRDGFLILPEFISSDLCDLLMARAQQLITAHEPQTNKTVFSTQHSSHAKHDYFIHSGDKIHFFYEDRAINEKGELTRDKAFCINKIGHALHDLDPVFNCFSRLHKIAKLIELLNVKDPLLVQSMYICKQPFIGDEVNCHQDSTYIYMPHEPVIGLWFALEDATLENGCLWAIPGAHKAPLKSRSIRNAQDEITTEIYDKTPWNLSGMVPLEVKRGSLIVLHGHLPHMSKTNLSAKSRHAYTLHVVTGRENYPKDNWLQRSLEMPFRGF